MKNITRYLTICILFFAISSTLSIIVMAQAIKPLSGTKGARAINDGVQHFNQGKLNTALSHFQKALKKNPRSGVAHYNLALTYNRLGKSDQAAKHFQKASKFGRGNTFIQHSSILKQHTQNVQKKR